MTRRRAGVLRALPTAGLLVLVTALGARLLAPSAAPPAGPGPVIGAAAAGLPADPPAPVAPPPLAALAAFVERPPFEPGRRPPPPAPGDVVGLPAAAVAMPDEPPAIAGIVTLPGRRRVLLRQPGGALPVWAGEGETVAGWEVRAIHERGIEIGRGDTARWLGLDEN